MSPSHDDDDDAAFDVRIIRQRTLQTSSFITTALKIIFTLKRVTFIKVKRV